MTTTPTAPADGGNVPEPVAPTASPSVRNLLLDAYERLPEVIRSCVPDIAPVDDGAMFTPGFALPALDDALRDFLSVATAGWHLLGSHAGHPLKLLDLTHNPGTHTTKTFASLLIVARAVEYHRRTGRNVMIFSPTSANKGVALRDAVLRAITCGLVEPEALRVTTLAPRACLRKLRASRMSTDPRLRVLNPLLVQQGDEPEQVKAIGREFVRRHSGDLWRRHRVKTWFSLDLANYMVADAARAFLEQEVDPADQCGRPRLHAHAVSSAFGLLGYHHGRALLERDETASSRTRPASLLVQHLGTPDMVLHVRHGSFSRDNVPRYLFDDSTGMYHQAADPYFPTTTYAVDEVLDPTFYTHRPATSERMDAIIRRHGGTGIVVSLAECVARYPQVRTLLSGVTRPLPPDFRELSEWSLVMAMTGVLNAIDRGLVADECEVVVHGSGYYSIGEFEPVPATAVIPVTTVEDIATAVSR